MFQLRTVQVGGLVVLGALLVTSTGLAQESDTARVYGGRATGYRDLDRSSLEQVSTPERIVAVTRANVAPMEVWRALEHAEKVECLSCIPHVAKLLYNDNAKTREISAWWLRRRIFGVFGPGQVYQQTVQTLNDATQPAARRAAAAEALGEFMTHAGVRHVALAAVGDSSARVRLSAVRALQRLNSEGPAGELATALADQDEQVRLAAVNATLKINKFTGVEALVLRLSDPSSSVRVKAILVLGQLKARAAVPGLVLLTDPANEGNPEARAAAVAALGRIGDSAGRQAVTRSAASDPDRHVRNAARISQRRL